MNQRYIIRTILAILTAAIVLGVVIAAIFSSGESRAVAMIPEYASVHNTLLYRNVLFLLF